MNDPTAEHPIAERPTVFRADAVRRHLGRVAEPMESGLDPPHWIALLWLVAIAVAGLAWIVLR